MNAREGRSNILFLEDYTLLIVISQRGTEAATTFLKETQGNDTEQIFTHL